jgi:hypothetical protein
MLFFKSVLEGALSRQPNRTDCAHCSSVLLGGS